MIPQCHAGRGDDAAALSAALQAIKDDPDDYYSLQLAGRLYVKLGQHEQARDYVERSLAHVPNHSPALYRFLLQLAKAMRRLPRVRVREEEIEALRDPGKDDREWADWARQYLSWHAHGRTAEIEKGSLGER
jgi:tetratricopeptide (TPR) repeat protein